MKNRKFSMPEIITLNEQIFSYGTDALYARNHAFSLDKQVLCVELLNIFKNNASISSFVFSAIAGAKAKIKTTNEYEPEKYENNYTFHMLIDGNSYPSDSNIKIDDKKTVSIDITNSTFVNYVLNEEQESILYWILKTAKNSDVPCVYLQTQNETFFEFRITKPLVELLCKDAYGKHYSLFNAQNLEESLPPSPESTIHKNKI